MKLSLIGIGAGDPKYLTLQAIEAMQTVDVFFLVTKADHAPELEDFRRDICEQYVTNQDYKIVEVVDPERRRQDAAYENAVQDWRSGRADVWEAAISEHLSSDQHGAFLVWGDPALYDSTIDVIDLILERGSLAFDHEVIPGISSIQALTAKHRVPWNQVGRQVVITPARRVDAETVSDARDALVMLDTAAKDLAPGVDDDVEIYWGAYVGTQDEIYISGKLGEVRDEIETTRRQAREDNGWIMDSYLLRKRQS